MIKNNLIVYSSVTPCGQLWLKATWHKFHKAIIPQFYWKCNNEQRKVYNESVLFCYRPPGPGLSTLLLALLVAVAAASEVAKEPELITEPRPGQEYVLVNSRNTTTPTTTAVPSQDNHHHHHKKGKDS